MTRKLIIIDYEKDTGFGRYEVKTVYKGLELSEGIDKKEVVKRVVSEWMEVGDEQKAKR